jgi:DNA-binding MarR family transcriptional regulator
MAREGGQLIARVHQVSGRVFSKLLRERGIHELNPAQGRIMFALWQEDRVPIASLAERTSLGKSTLTLMLDRLEASGLVRRVRSPSDRRAVLIERTAKDRALQKRYDEVSRRMTELFYAGLESAEIDAFEATLRRVLGNVAARERAGR